MYAACVGSPADAAPGSAAPRLFGADDCVDVVATELGDDEVATEPGEEDASGDDVVVELSAATDEVAGSAPDDTELAEAREVAGVPELLLELHAPNNVATETQAMSPRPRDFDIRSPHRSSPPGQQPTDKISWASPRLPDG